MIESRFSQIGQNLGRHRPAFRRAMTLIELVVVLTILVILAGVALQMTAGRMDQARYEATKRILDEVQAAIVGEQAVLSRSHDHAVKCFVADIGRPPAAWEELFQPAQNFKPFEIVKVNYAGVVIPPTSVDYNVLDFYPVATIMRGWRGPYIQMPVGDNSLVARDGWGRDLIPEMQNGWLQRIVSYGSDGIPDEPGEIHTLDVFKTDLDVDLPGLGTWIEGNVWLEILGSSIDKSHVKRVYVRYFLPNPDLSPSNEFELIDFNVFDEHDARTDLFLESGRLRGAFDSNSLVNNPFIPPEKLTVGPRAMVAFVVYDDGSGPKVRCSQTKYIIVRSEQSNPVVEISIDFSSARNVFDYPF